MIRCPKCKSIRVAVYQRRCNFSAFNGYKYTPSRYSGVRCRSCNWPWRTLADVSSLPDICRGHDRPPAMGDGPPIKNPNCAECYSRTL